MPAQLPREATRVPGGSLLRDVSVPSELVRAFWVLTKCSHTTQSLGDSQLWDMFSRLLLTRPFPNGARIPRWGCDDRSASFKSGHSFPPRDWPLRACASWVGVPRGRSTPTVRGVRPLLPGSSLEHLSHSIQVGVTRVGDDIRPKCE